MDSSNCLKPEFFRDICESFLGSEWSQLDVKDLKITQIEGGLTNYMFKCTNTKIRQGSKHKSPATVLVRIYGEAKHENPQTLSMDAITFALLAVNGISPQLYGIFPEGRIEQYIESRNLTTKELPSKSITSRIAQHLAQVHALDLPLDKRPKPFIDAMDAWLTTLRAAGSTKIPGSSVTFDEYLTANNIDAEMKWIKALLKDNSDKIPVVFSHNDLQENNILYIEDSSDLDGFRIQFIDFEFSTYNYRAFDIGNHFCEWMFDYTTEDWPHFTYKPDDFPSVYQQIFFWNAYQGYYTTDLTPENQLLREVQIGVALANIYWIFWSLSQAKNSTIKFGFKEYADSRVDHLKRIKNMMKNTI